MRLFPGTIESPLGQLHATVCDKGVCALQFTAGSPVTPSETHPMLDRLRLELREYFEGRLTDFAIPLHIDGTAFQKSVWNELQKIPFGDTIAYAMLARRIGNGAATRAVAAANGQNRLMVLIPCHRVVGSNGSLTGYAGGLANKAWLLRHEQAFRHSGAQTELQWPVS